MVYLCFIFPRHKMEVFMKDVSILNEMIFSTSTENELQEKFKDIYHRINNE
ncbi:UDP-4-amino-4-deoxy-L-arabinose-oxoglutarate aminotransferase, partial [Escherichia coli]|nr:UDP-4-amino-4-deoxy-L-arabinose-oxoglutarate aminotransferase [Escherichia coli]